MTPNLTYFVKLKDGATERHCWVNKRVWAGNRITLKNSDEPERWWDVVWAGEMPRTAGLHDSSWHVGGL
jgi:hypothetical protein